MFDIDLKYINPIKILVLFTFFNAWIHLQRKNVNNIFVMGILLTCAVTEIATSVFLYFNIPNGFFVSCSIIVHDLLWLALLQRNVSYTRSAGIGVQTFLIFGIVNLFFLDTSAGFNYYAFVVGAFLFVIIFLTENLHRIKKEDIEFFISDEYLLLSAPILFFVNMSLMFGFESYELGRIKVIGAFNLYDFLIYFVNISYYLLINIYVHRNKQEKYLIN